MAVVTELTRQLGFATCSSSVAPTAFSQWFAEACSLAGLLSVALEQSRWSLDMQLADSFRRDLGFKTFASVMNGRSLLSLCCEKSATREEMLPVLRGLLQTEAAEHIQAETAGYGMTNLAGYSPVMHLAASGDKAGIRSTMLLALVEVRADVNFKGGAYGMTPLLKASASGNYKVVECLLHTFRVPADQVDYDGHNGFDFSHNNARIRTLFRNLGVEEGVKVDGRRRRCHAYCSGISRCNTCTPSHATYCDHLFNAFFSSLGCVHLGR
jgi:hypothetical protein